MGEVIKGAKALKPVLVQNLIQAAKKKRGGSPLLDAVGNTDSTTCRSRQKDRSTSIIVAILVVFFILTVLMSPFT